MVSREEKVVCAQWQKPCGILEVGGKDDLPKLAPDEKEPEKDESSAEQTNDPPKTKQEKIWLKVA